MKEIIVLAFFGFIAWNVLVPQDACAGVVADVSRTVTGLVAVER
jgi:hypothetical protein